LYVTQPWTSACGVAMRLLSGVLGLWLGLTKFGISACFLHSPGLSFASYDPCGG
jgi:hypothetical protein